MKTIRYNTRDSIPPELGVLMQCRQEDNSETLSRLHRNLRLARVNELTPRQAEVLELYYEEGKSIRQIARELGVFPSTVSRTIARAQKRLQHCLQYAF